MAASDCDWRDMKITQLSELFASISDQGRQWLGRRPERDAPITADTLTDVANRLLSRSGEASGIALANALLLGYGALGNVEKLAFFQVLARVFGPDRARLVDRTILRAFRSDPKRRH